MQEPDDQTGATILCTQAARLVKEWVLHSGKDNLHQRRSMLPRVTLQADMLTRLQAAPLTNWSVLLCRTYCLTSHTAKQTCSQGRVLRR